MVLRFLGPPSPRRGEGEIEIARVQPWELPALADLDQLSTGRFGRRQVAGYNPLLTGAIGHEKELSSQMADSPRGGHHSCRRRDRLHRV